MPEPYLLAEESQLVTLYPNRDRDIYFENYKRPTIEIIKQNEITHDPLENVPVQIWYASNNTSTGEYNDLGVFYTDEEGRIVLSDPDSSLRDGWFRIEELEAPKGFSLTESSKQEAFVAAGEGHTFRIYNRPNSAIVVWKYDSVHPEQAMEDTGLEEYLDRRQLALRRVQQERYQEALDLYPCAYTWLRAGMDHYARGDSYAAAVECLSQAYQRASAQGYVRLMLLSKIYMGNCYCGQFQLEQMEEQYRVAQRLAQALGDESTLRVMHYNQASGYLGRGQYQKAYAYFSTVDQPTGMELQKLALCCEKLGLTSQALEALDRADEMDWNFKLGRRMCRLVRYRLEHPDYLHHPEYGTQLLQVFQDCQTQLPMSFAAFHLPWVLEWYTANRQYRTAYELLRDFPIKVNL